MRLLKIGVCQRQTLKNEQISENVLKNTVIVTKGLQLYSTYRETVFYMHMYMYT